MRSPMQSIAADVLSLHWAKAAEAYSRRQWATWQVAEVLFRGTVKFRCVTNVLYSGRMCKNVKADICTEGCSQIKIILN